MGEEVLIMVTVLGGGVLVVRFLIEALRHRERMAALERGVALPAEVPGSGVPQIYLLRGMMWLFSGIALIGFLVTIPNDRRTDLEFTLVQSQKLKEMGASQQQIDQYFVDHLNRKEFPEGLEFIGLIPAWIGVAYLIFYAVERRRYNSMP